MHPKPKNALTADEKKQIIATANSPEFASLPPEQIVAKLADKNVYIASERSFYRVLRENKMLKHRGKARAKTRSNKPKELRASAPRQVWVWDVTYLATRIKGDYLKFYALMDLYSRKIVSWEVFPDENAENSHSVLHKGYLAEKGAPMHLHSDNGMPFKNANVYALMHRLEIGVSHSRPKVSNDNPHAEAFFRTAKYHPSLPEKPFESIDEARNWAQNFVRWYNNEHCHKSIGWVTPNQKHCNADAGILGARRELYLRAKEANPARWIKGKTRQWNTVTSTTLNPISDKKMERKIKLMLLKNKTAI